MLATLDITEQTNKIIGTQSQKGRALSVRRHKTNNRTGGKFSWLTKKKYSSDDALRSDLAFRRDWGLQ